MNKKIRMLCIIACMCFVSNHINPASIISLFLRPYPSIPMEQNKMLHKAEKLKQPGRISYYHVKNLMRNSYIAGIFAAYAGYITVSTSDGHLTFPNKQSKPIIYLLCTRRLTPITMIGTTIHHWELEEGTPAAFYKIERKQDEDTEKFYWQIQAEPLPDNSVIPVKTLWLVAQPRKVYVPLGITLTDKNQNYILPTIYVKKGIMNIKNALYMLNIKQFFRPVKKEIRREGKAIQKIIT